MGIVRLAILNVRSQLNRSLATLVVIGIGAMVLTTGLSYSQGTLRHAFREYSDYLDGDVMVFSPGFITAAPLSNTPKKIARRVLIESWWNPVLQFFPTLATRGYFTKPEFIHAPIDQETLRALASIENVAEVVPYKAMPVELYGQRTILRSPPRNIDGLIVEGRMPSSEATELEIVVNGYGHDLELRLGQRLMIDIPAYGVDAEGLPLVDRKATGESYWGIIVGIVHWPSRIIGWPANEGPTWEQGYIHSPEIYVDNKVWAELWHTHSHGLSYPITALSLRLKDLGQLYPTVSTVRTATPQLAVFSVPDLRQQAEIYNPIDKFYIAPRGLWEPREPAPDFGEQDDYGGVTAVLLFLNAGMLMASQMLAAVTARKQEIGVLKALGARQREVVGMIMLEALALALLGALSGFLLVRFAAMYQSLSNGHTLARIMGVAFKELLIVLAATFSMALVFGVLPAIRVAKLTVMEVFRNE